MSKELNTTSRSILKLTLVAAGFGMLVAASAQKASAEANCPQWSTPVCQHWNLGPPPSCTAWACAADKKSDPPKVEGVNTVGTGNPQPNPGVPPRRIIDPIKIGTAPVTPGGPGGVTPPIVVKPPVVTTGGINGGTGTTATTIYAQRNNFKPVVHHTTSVNVKATFARPILRDMAYRQPAFARSSANAMAMHMGGGGGGHGHR